MIPIVFINCDSVPFVDDIMNRRKILETRTRNMLRAIVGQPVLIAETRRGRRPVVRCMVQFDTPAVAESREAWETIRSAAGIPAGSKYDWQPDTRRKWAYYIETMLPVEPFTPPEDVRHGRVWMEYNGKEVWL